MCSSVKFPSAHSQLVGSVKGPLRPWLTSAWNCRVTLLHHHTGMQRSCLVGYLSVVTLWLKITLSILPLLHRWRSCWHPTQAGCSEAPMQISASSFNKPSSSPFPPLSLCSCSAEVTAWLEHQSLAKMFGWEIFHLASWSVTLSGDIRCI